MNHYSGTQGPGNSSAKNSASSSAKSPANSSASSSAKSPANSSAKSGANSSANTSANTSIDTQTAIGILWQIAHLVFSLHEMGTFHGDLTLDNIFITAPNTISHVLIGGVAVLHKKQNSVSDYVSSMQVVDFVKLSAIMTQLCESPAFQKIPESFKSLFEVSSFKGMSRSNFNHWFEDKVRGHIAGVNIWNRALNFRNISRQEINQTLVGRSKHLLFFVEESQILKNYWPTMAFRPRSDRPVAFLTIPMSPFENPRLLDQTMQKYSELLSGSAIEFPLHALVHSGSHFSLIDELLKQGFDINERTPDARGGFTPLIVAAHEGRLDTVLYLVAHGARVDDVDAHGYSALTVASRLGHSHVAYALREIIAVGNAATSSSSAGISSSSLKETAPAQLDWESMSNLSEILEGSELDASAEELLFNNI